MKKREEITTAIARLGIILTCLTFIISVANGMIFQFIELLLAGVFVTGVSLLLTSKKKESVPIEEPVYPAVDDYFGIVSPAFAYKEEPQETVNPFYSKYNSLYDHNKNNLI